MGIHKFVELTIPLAEGKVISAATRIGMLFFTPPSAEEHLLTYMVRHSSPDMIYCAEKGSRQKYCDRHNITVGQYKTALRKLLESGVIQKVDSVNDGTYCYYDIMIKKRIRELLKK